MTEHGISNIFFCNEWKFILATHSLIEGTVDNLHIQVVRSFLWGIVACNILLTLIVFQIYVKTAKSVSCFSDHWIAWSFIHIKKRVSTYNKRSALVLQGQLPDSLAALLDHLKYIMVHIWYKYYVPIILEYVSLFKTLDIGLWGVVSSRAASNGGYAPALCIIVALEIQQLKIFRWWFLLSCLKNTKKKKINIMCM